MLETDLSSYIETVLHTPLPLAPWSNSDRLPGYLKDYSLLSGTLFGRPLLFAFRTNDDLNPREITKQLGQLRRYSSEAVVFVTDTLSSAARASLIEGGVPFVVPNNQMYLPEWGMDLREHFRARRVWRGDNLSPVAQVIVLASLLQSWDNPIIPTQLASRLNYTAMSVGRGFDELANAGLAMVKKVGREKRLSFMESGRDRFEAALPYLRNPEQRSQPMRNRGRPLKLPVSGETALAFYTDLAPPGTPSVATGPSWVAGGDIHLEPCEPFEADLWLERWCYDPEVLAEGDVVDRLSLYIRYRDNSDARVAAAAHQLLEDMPWQL